jgi:phosphomevalonate kinase
VVCSPQPKEVPWVLLFPCTRKKTKTTELVQKFEKKRKEKKRKEKKRKEKREIYTNPDISIYVYSQHGFS